jgi:hypothetical protein
VLGRGEKQKEWWCVRRTSGDVGTLVVTAQEEEVFGIFDLVAKQEEDGLETLLSAIDIVAQEEVVCARGEPTHLKETYEVGILSVDVAYDLDWRAEFDEGGLGEEDLGRGLADGGDLCVLEHYRLCDLAAVPHVEQPSDHVVHVERL